MSITEVALKNNRITLVLLVIIFLSGYMSYVNMPRNLDPGFIIRAATVTAFFPGVSPERMELLVADKIEKTVREMPELDFVESQSFTGMTRVTVNIKESYKDMRPIWDKLRRKVESAERKLPQGVTSVVVNDEYGDVFGIVLGLTGDGYNFKELKDIADAVRDEFLLIPEVAKIDIYGAQERRVFVEYNNARLAELGLSPQQLAGILQSRNISISGGDLVTGVERIALEPSGNFESIEDLENTLITIPGTSQVMRLGDTVTIESGYADPPGAISHVTGTPGLMLGISMREGGNYISLGQAVTEKIQQLQTAYPIGVEFSVLSFLPNDISKSINNFSSSLIQSVSIVLIVMLAFLGLRTGLIVGSLIPAAIVMAFLIMSFFDIGLDQMSLTSLIIALGLLVDNAIVVTESTLVRMEQGKPARQAAVESARELMVPLLTSSLTTAAAFLPIFLAQSNVGEYTAPLFKVVSITLLSSWILSITMIPLLCITFLKVKVKQQTSPGRSLSIYKTVITWALHHKYLTVVGVAGFFASGIFMLSFVPNIFFPASDNSYFQVDVELPVGTDVRETQKSLNQIEDFIKANLMEEEVPGRKITTWQTHINSGGPRFTLGYNPPPAQSNKAVMVINVADAAYVHYMIEQLDKYIRRNMPELSASVKAMGTGPAGDYPIEVRLSGTDNNTLFQLVEKTKAKLREIPGVAVITDNWGAQTKKINVSINQARAQRAGVSNEDIARSLQTGLSGLELTRYREGDESIPVLLRSNAADRSDLGKIENVNVYVQATGASIPLRQVADFEITWQPSVIIRRDGVRTVTVQARQEQGLLPAQIMAELKPWLAEESKQWPVGHRYAYGGDEESSVKANQSIGDQLPIAGLLVLLLLVGQFNSVRRAAIILSTIPLGIVGVAFGLLVTGSSMGFMTLLGIISLSGIIINNSIMLIDRTDIEINDNGLPPSEAIIAAALQRFRPILLTTATTSLGLMPLWLGQSPLFTSMAVAMIFGLVFATLLTLGVVPVLYAIFFRVKYQKQNSP